MLSLSPLPSLFPFPLLAIDASLTARQLSGPLMSDDDIYIRSCNCMGGSKLWPHFFFLSNHCTKKINGNSRVYFFWKESKYTFYLKLGSFYKYQQIDFLWIIASMQKKMLPCDRSSVCTFKVHLKILLENVQFTPLNYSQSLDNPLNYDLVKFTP